MVHLSENVTFTTPHKSTLAHLTDYKKIANFCNRVCILGFYLVLSIFYIFYLVRIFVRYNLLTGVELSGPERGGSL